MKIKFIVLDNAVVWEKPDSFIDADSVNWKEEKREK